MTLKRSEFKRKAPIRAARPTGVLAQASFARVRAKKCAICREPFTPARPGAKVCGPRCAEAFGIAASAKAARIAAKAVRAADKVKRESLKSRADWERETQTAVNAFIRLVRDADKTCISCGRWHDGQWHAGHYLSRGARPGLRCRTKCW